jgi:hypothetical protein
MTEYDTVGLILICSDAAVLFGEKQKYVFHVPLIRHTKSHWSKTQIYNLQTYHLFRIADKKNYKENFIFLNRNSK